MCIIENTIRNRLYRQYNIFMNHDAKDQITTAIDIHTLPDQEEKEDFSLFNNRIKI